MANVRLLRQLVSDYNNRIDKANTDYEKRWGIYEQAVNAYNAKIEDAKSGTPYVGQTSKGWGIFGGVDSRGNIAYKSSAKVYNSASELPKTDKIGVRMLVREGDRYQEYKPQVTLPRYNSAGGFKPSGQYYSALPTASDVPSEPAGPDEIAPINLTEKDKGLLQNPTLGPSEMNMAAARGVVGKSNLSGDELSAPISAFADPEDPNNLKERGVLARVLGGQL